MNPAPIILFAYNRPEHTAATLEALARNTLAAESELTIFCDGPRTPEQAAKTEAVREVARGATGFRKVTVVERSENLGLARSVITGVTATLEEHENVIVLEDDLMTSPHFLSFMNAGLEHYAADERVISVCAYTHPVGPGLPDAFFLPGAFCWGWATWRRGWALFDHDATRVFSEILRRNLMYEFDFGGTDPLTLLYSHALHGGGRADSWALRWFGAACLHGKLSLYPGTSLVSNTGFDGSGRHAPIQNRYSTPLAERPLVVDPAAVQVRPDAEAVRRYRALFRRWRIGKSRKRALYYAVASRLPRAAEKLLYSMSVRHSIRKTERRLKGR